MYLGAHISIAKGLYNAVQTSVEMGGNTFQFFTRNPRGGRAKKLDEQDILKAQQLMKANNFGPLVAHSPYTYNLASKKPEVREFSLRMLREDFQRVKTVGVPYIVLHPGSHGGQGEEMGLDLVAAGLKDVLAEIPTETFLLLEGMAGSGTELGYTMKQLGSLITQCDNHPQLGVCLDSCHLTGAGYDLTRLDELKDDIEKEVGFDRLKVFHLNDSIHPVGSRRDRHAKLGEGELGLDIIKSIIFDEDLSKAVFILETPNDEEGYAREIALIKEWQ